MTIKNYKLEQIEETLKYTVEFQNIYKLVPFELSIVFKGNIENCFDVIKIYYHTIQNCMYLYINETELVYVQVPMHNNDSTYKGQFYPISKYVESINFYVAKKD